MRNGDSISTPMGGGSYYNMGIGTSSGIASGVSASDEDDD